MRAVNRFLFYLSLFAYSLALPYNWAAAEAPQQSQNNITYGFPPIVETTSRKELPPHEFQPEELEKKQQAVREYWQKLKTEKGNQITQQDVIKLYDLAGDFLVIHGLIGNVISVEDSFRIGTHRRNMHQAALEQIAKDKKFGERFGINNAGDRGSQNKIDAVTRIEFTPFCDNQSVEGSDMVNAYNHAFLDLTGISPERMEIFAKPFESNVPDWLKNRITAEFSNSLRSDISLLSINPEAFFLDQAYQLSFLEQENNPNRETFIWYTPDAQGNVTPQRTNAALQKAFFYHPESVDLYAWGASVANWHFFNAHPQNFIDMARNVLRSIDEGVGLTLGPQKTENFINLGPIQRQSIIQALYGSSFSANDLEVISMTLETAVNISKNRFDLDLSTEEGNLKVFSPLINLEKKRAVIELDQKVLLAKAYKNFRKISLVILIQNNLITTGPDRQNWVKPAIEPDTALTVVYEDGSIQLESISHAILEQLQFASFFELRNALRVMQDPMIAKLEEQNPASKNDIEVLTHLISKEREMIAAPEKIPDNEATQYRENHAIETLAEYRLVKQIMQSSPYSTTNWKNGGALPAKGTELNTWLQEAVEKSFPQISVGPKYLPILQKMHSETIHLNSPPLLSIEWIAKIDKTQSIVEILKSYVREGKINEKVLITSLQEGLNFIPGIALLYSVEGNLENSTTFKLVRTIPGYQNIVLNCKLDNTTVALASRTAFKPIENEEIKNAYEGSLSKPQKIESTHLPLLYPVNPQDSFTVDEAREKMYHYLHQLVLQMIKNDESIWYTEAEKPRQWQQKEFEYLNIIARQYVNDWWNGTGPFQDTHPQSSASDKDLRDDLLKQLVQDYITGTNIEIENHLLATEEQKRNLMELFAEIAGIDAALDKECDSQEQNFKTAGNIFFAYMLDQMPSEPSSVEILGVPYLKSLKTEGDEIKRYTSDFINVRATVKGSFKDHPGPWHFKWKFEPEKQPSENTSERYFTSVSAIPIDSNKKVIAHNSITLIVEGIKPTLNPNGDQKGEEENNKARLDRLNSILSQLQELNESSAKAAASIQTACTYGKNKAIQAIPIIDDLIARFKPLNESFNEITVNLTEIKEQTPNLENYNKTIDENEKKLTDAKEKGDGLALQACDSLSEISITDSPSDRKKLLETAHSAREDLVKLHKSALNSLTVSLEAAQKIYRLRDSFKSVSQKIENLRNELSGFDFSIRTARKEIDDATTASEDSEESLDLLSNNADQSAMLTDEAHKLLKQIKAKTGDIEVTRDKIDSLDSVISNIKSDNKNCPTELKKLLIHFSEKHEEFDLNLRKNFEKIDQFASSLQEKGLSTQIDTASENANVGIFSIELSWEALSESLREAERCEKLGQAAIQLLTEEAMPDVRGLSVKNATNKLTEMKLKVNRIGGNPAPNDELSFKIESQIPLPGTMIKAGDIVTIAIYGQHREPLPDVRGMTPKEAMGKLSGLQLRVSKVDGDPAPSEDLAFKVEFQNPSPGAKVVAGDTVTLTIYGSYSPVSTMPDVIGLAQDKALEKLKALGLKPEIVEGDSPPNKNSSNTIQRQVPAAGKQLPSGADVSIVVYGKFKSVIPDVLGLNIEDAKKLIVEEELKPIVQNGDPAPIPAKENQVYLQYPLPGSDIPENGSVTLSIYTKFQEGAETFIPRALNKTPFYVVCDNYMATPTSTPPKDGEANKDKSIDNAINQLFQKLESPGNEDLRSRYERWINSLKLSDVTFTIGETPVIFHVEGQGLRFYEPTFFEPRKQLSTTLDIELKGKHKISTINGALLLEVAGVYKTSDELYKAYPKAQSTSNLSSAILSISRNDGTFHYSTTRESMTYSLSGGPLLDGWPNLMKERNLDLMKHLRLLFNCFIISAVYDYVETPQLDTFRIFRDSIMLSSTAGQHLIDHYYTFGPQWAVKIHQSPFFKSLLHPVFDTLAYCLDKIDLSSPVAKIFFGFIISTADFILTPFYNSR